LSKILTAFQGYSHKQGGATAEGRLACSGTGKEDGGSLVSGSMFASVMFLVLCVSLFEVAFVDVLFLLNTFRSS